jgi:4-amino-4-deoxy-L-arabinose transferase-like glycosyltransferase
VTTLAAERTSGRASTRWGLLLSAVAIAGIALRVWVYRSKLGIPNSDEAVMGLMARHVLHGQFTVFFWGASYGGPLEALLAVPGLAIAGSSWLALRLVPLALSIVALVLIWRVGLRLLGERQAVGAAALFWIWPPFLIYQFTHEISFYASDVVFTSLLLLLALRIVERPDRLRVGLFGLALGIGFWETPQIVPIAVPLIGWIAWKAPRAFRHAWLAVLLAVAGALPWIAWNVAHHWSSFTIRSGISASYTTRLRIVESPLLPTMLGLRTPLTMTPVIPGALVDVVYGSLVALFAFGAYRNRRTVRSVLYVTAAVFPFLLAIESQAGDPGGTRYLVVAAPVIVLLVAQAMTTWARTAAILAVAALLSFSWLHKTESVPPEVPKAPRSIAPLIATLDRFRLNRVYAQYWVAYVLDFDTRERIVAVENKFDSVTFPGGQAQVPDDRYVYYAPYQREVKASRHGFVFFRQGLGAVPIIPRLEAHGYRRVDTGPFVVFVPPG